MLFGIQQSYTTIYEYFDMPNYFWVGYIQCGNVVPAIRALLYLVSNVLPYLHTETGR